MLSYGPCSLIQINGRMVKLLSAETNRRTVPGVIPAKFFFHYGSIDVRCKPIHAIPRYCGCYSSHRETAVLGASLQDFNMNRTLNIRIGCITCLDVLRIGELHGNTKLKTTSSPYTPQISPPRRLLKTFSPPLPSPLIQMSTII